MTKKIIYWTSYEIYEQYGIDGIASLLLTEYLPEQYDVKKIFIDNKGAIVLNEIFLHESFLSHIVERCIESNQCYIEIIIRRNDQQI